MMEIIKTFSDYANAPENHTLTKKLLLQHTVWAISGRKLLISITFYHSRKKKPKINCCYRIDFASKTAIVIQNKYIWNYL